MSTSKTESVEKQRIRYKKEASEHYLHNQDFWNQRYRDEFMRPTSKDIDLKGKTVLEGMCASGTETAYLLGQGAKVVGLDISEENASFYRKKWNADCHVRSIHDTQFQKGSFDAVWIIGGLHHVIPLLPSVIDEMHRILKPGGHFFFVEPNADTWLNMVRSLWYALSSRFEKEERALSYQKDLQPLIKGRFLEREIILSGNIAYLIIAQSLVTRIPKSVRKKISKSMFELEKWLSAKNIAPKLFFSGLWQKI